MRKGIFSVAVPLSLAACWGLASPAAWAGVTISRVELDGQPQTMPVTTNHALRLSSAAQSTKFYFTEHGPDGRPTARLRYKLEGYDNLWRDLSADPPHMKIAIIFKDQHKENVGEEEFGLVGETPGWRGTIEKSDFVMQRAQFTAPERSVSIRIAIRSGGSPSVIGLLAVDDLRVRIENPARRQTAEYDLSVTNGTDLDQPLGCPANWVREGPGADMAQLHIRPTPRPHPILIMNDGHPRRYAFWNTKPQCWIPVQPHDQITLEWQAAYSLGRSGPGIAEYPPLNPGTYLFRVATANASGTLLGSAVTLPLDVRQPLYYRIEFWLGIMVLVSISSGWLGHIVVRRRMQRKLIEFERQHALEHERARIARDLHDDIGAGLTEIAMQSDWVHSDLAQQPTTETRQRVARIRQAATELARGVDEIVWAVTPANDTLKRFINYLTQNMAQFLDTAGLRVRFDIPADFPDSPLAGKIRHHLFLTVREALNNTVKHARADLVRLELRMASAGLRITIEDNGCGFAPEQAGVAGTHEGLDNMRRRMAEIGGQFHLHSQPGGGTRIELFAPLPVATPAQPGDTP